MKGIRKNEKYFRYIGITSDLSIGLIYKQLNAKIRKKNKLNRARQYKKYYKHK